MNKLIIASDLPDEGEVGPNEWGCGFNEHGSRLCMPIKARDPLLEVPNGVGYNVNSSLTYISEKRSERKSDSNSSEVLGKIVAGEKKDIVIALDDRILENKLFSGKPEISCLNDYLAVTVVNKFSAGIRCVDETVYANQIKQLELSGINIAFMPCLVTFPVKYPNDLKVLDNIRLSTPNLITGDYFQEIDKTPLSHLESVLLSMQSSIKAYVKKANEAGINLVIIRPFMNQGVTAGATLRRLHFQTYIDMTPGHTSTDEALLKAFDKGSCVLCTSDHSGRELYNNGEFTLWVTNAPVHNYHLRLAPNDHTERFTDLSARQIRGLADVLKKGNAILSKIGVTNNRNTIFHTLFEGYRSKFHFFADIIPHYPEGAVEKYGGVSVVWVSPLRASEELKKALGEIQINDYTYT